MSFFSKRNEYSAVDVSEEAGHEKEQSTLLQRRPFHDVSSFVNIGSLRDNLANFPTCAVLLGLTSLLLIVDILFRYHQSATYCNGALSLQSPVVEATASRTNVYFNNSLVPDGSPWRNHVGKLPNTEIDALWESVIHEGVIGISDDEVRNLGKNPADFRRVPASLHSKHGDKVLAGTEFSHHLHCLNMIRKFTYFDHYRDDHAFYGLETILVRTHIDHCIDTLRQVLMCHPDEGLYLSYWYAGGQGLKAVADFNTMHRCKDFGAMMEWADAREIREELPKQPGDGERVWERKTHP